MKLSEIQETKPKGMRLSQVDAGGEKENPSSAGAFGRAAAEQALPTASMIAGGELGSFLGPVGALAGGALGYYAGEKGQEQLGRLIPQSVKQATGFTPEQRKEEKSKYPISTLAGSLGVPSLAGAVKAGPSVARAGQALFVPEKTVG